MTEKDLFEIVIIVIVSLIMAIIIIPLWCANKIKFKFQALFGLSIFGLFSFIYGFIVGMFSFGIVVIVSLIINSLTVKFHEFFLRLFSRNLERIFRFFIAIVLLTITIILILALSSFGIVAIASLISGSFVDLPGFFLKLLEVFTVIILLTITIIIIPLWCFNKIKLESLLELFVFLSDPNISFKDLLQFVFQYILSETFNKTVSYYFEEAESVGYKEILLLLIGISCLIIFEAISISNMTLFFEILTP